MPTFGQRGLPQFPICKEHKRPGLQFRSTSPRRPKAGWPPAVTCGPVRFVGKGLWATLDRFQHLWVQPALHQRGARIHCRGKEPAQCYQSGGPALSGIGRASRGKNRRRPSPARPWPLQLITTRGSEVGATVPLEILPSPERLSHEARVRFWIRPASRYRLGRDNCCLIGFIAI